MNFWEWLFGEESGTVHQGSTLDEEQKALMGALSAYLRGQTGQGIYSRGAEQLGTLLDQALGSGSTLSALLSQQGVEDWIQSNVVDRLRREYREDVLPQIEESFVGPGTYWGSARAQASTRAAKDLASTIAEQSTTARLQALDRAREIFSTLSGAARARAELDYTLSPQNNPALQQALELIGIPTTYTYFEEPAEGALGDLLKLGATIFAPGSALGTSLADLLRRIFRREGGGSSAGGVQ